MAIISNGDKIMKRVIQKSLVAIFICSLVGTSVLPFALASDSQQNQTDVASAPYTGRLRIYVTEPVSRWNMYDGNPYHFGFLGFAHNGAISIDAGDTYTNSMTWNGDVTESNVMVMAVVFNSEAHQGYAYPPSGNPFTAYYTDATAAATPGNTGYNVVNEDFTHSVFVEEATATWCPYCPAMATALYNIYNSGDYPWYFTALVSDMNSQAAARLSEFNTYGYPTAFFDGGYQVYVGGSSSESVYRSRIVNCGNRVVPNLNLSVSVSYIGSGDLQIDVEITNNEVPIPLSCDAGGPYNGNINDVIQFTGSASGGTEPYTYAWNFGDGGTGTGPNPTHGYTAAGEYTVTLTVTDHAQTVATDTATATITESNEEPIIVVDSIAGGFGVKAVIKNIGTGDATGVSWTIALDGKMVFIGKSKTGTIDVAAGESVTIKSFVFGFGATNINVTADTATKSATGKVLLFFVTGVV
jgi:thiol-disulfide isomerase/thioredoxin